MLSHGRLSILSNGSLVCVPTETKNYSALVESQLIESQTVESTVASSVTIEISSTEVESIVSALLLAALFPQDAKETAANATNKNTNFFIFFAFLICNTKCCFY